MRILVVCEGTNGNSGWHTYAKTLCTALVQAGHDVTTCTSDSGALHKPMQYLSRPWARWMDAWKLRQLAVYVKPDVIHIAVEPFALAAMLLPARYANRTVVTLHGSYAVWLCRKPSAVRWMCRHGVRCVAVSMYTKKRCMEEGGDILDRFINVVYTAMPTPPVFKKAPHDIPHILLVGGVKARKGVTEAIEAVARYRDRYGEVGFSIVGGYEEGHPYVQEVRRMIAQYKLEHSVMLTGRVDTDSLERLYAGTDLYLMPSQTLPDRFEGFGLVFLEAAARGIPCIGPKDSGSAEAIDEGVTGFCVDPSDTETMVSRMHAVLNNHQIAPDDCRTFAARFSVEKMTRGIEQAYLTPRD